MSIPSAADFRTHAVPYSVDNSASIPNNSFDRIGYYVGLTSNLGVLQWVSVSMDAFTSSAGTIGVPTTASGEIYQQAVTGLNVFSNVGSLLTGTGLSGEIQFWPSCSSSANSTGVLNATSAFDWGDTRVPTSGGVACNNGAFQIADPAAKQMLFSYNGWNSGSGISDLGIGNENSSNPNWTFAHNANSYSITELQVLVHETVVPSLPEPASLPVFGAGLAALVAMRRRPVIVCRATAG